MKKMFVVFAIMALSAGAAFSLMSDIKQRRGCCSHHGGVCGCSSGRAVCCDGTFSPSCGCD